MTKIKLAIKEQQIVGLHQKLTRENWTWWTQQFPKNYCHFHLGQHVNIQNLYTDKTKWLFDTTILRQLEQFWVGHIQKIRITYQKIASHQAKKKIDKLAKSQAGLTSFLAAGTFATTQHILDVASKFFRLNDISINNNKTVAIPINCRVVNLSLLINRMPIFVAKKSESHQYLDIFLSIESLSKPSLAKAHLNIKFFANLVLKKAISDKQFSYLVSLVLHSIVNYRTQFSFVPPSVYNKWDNIICKSLKSKSGLPLDFPNDVLHYLSLYDLNTFEQIQTEHKVAFVVSFANSVGILGHLFAHRSYDLQVLYWHPIHFLSSPAHIGVGASDNFLAGLVHIFHDYNFSLDGIRANAFHLWKRTPMVSVLGESRFVRCLLSLRHYGVAFVDQLRNHSGTAFTWAIFKCWKQLDSRGLVSIWFDFSVSFINMVAPVSITSSAVGEITSRNVLDLIEFVKIRDHLLSVSTDNISVYTDNSLAGLDTVGMWASAATFFDGVDLGLGVEVSGLVSSTIAELQAIALALECVPPSSSVYLFSDSQAALDTCKSELGLVFSEFRNRYWLERFKRHFGIVGNECVDALTTAATMSEHSLPLHVNVCYILVGGVAVFGNSRYFVCDIFHCVHHAQWETGSGSRHRSSLMWHSDMHMATSSTGKRSAGARTYFMKALYYRLSVAVRKCLYSRSYPNVLCLYCGEVEVSDHVFSCAVEHACSYLKSTLSLCSLAFLTLCCVRHFEVVSVFRNSKIACQRVVEFVWNFCLAFRNEVWLVRASHHALMEKRGLILRDDSVSGLMCGLSLLFSIEVIKMLGIAEAFGISFGFCAPCLFFLGIGDSVLVIIDA
ncbi:hypothetical protein G9A89_012205 [Geosiphon pyriformis]|nr:hypothetical protein G9A89_012205 [Geosiphon pyriformis]